ncbi:M81 family metallopeptidase [Enhydrobacter sp.]|uniref:M81 family metallopeptidase n=1 Tax=Enhydrobacter sp. TaxID=1894999 RepID=UPI00262721E7|nr:M81 family metallopeptidase [Enhydrobacter sp.]WIM14332.1 MAG: MlrC [Enhydrobacter sp.]
MTQKPIRIAVLHFAHETVTFLKNDTTLDDFVYAGSPAKGEALLAHDAKSYMGGFVKVAREYDGVELVGIESPLWPRTGTGSGWITTEAYETFLGKMIAGLKAKGPFDGVYLSLHGAMGVRGVARPEADIARRVREVVGRKAFIVGTFDPHGNEDAEFLREADMAFTVKYFPHYDSHLQGQRAARMLVRSIRGDYRPSTVTVKVPIISPTVLQWTGASPWMDLVQRALVWEAREPDVYVNVFFGFPFADVPDVGMTIQAMTNGNPALARKVADDMAAWAWRRREALLKSATVHRIAEGVKLAKEAVARGATPVVLADHSDRSGYATWTLKEVIAQDLSDVLIATVADAQAIDALAAKGVKAGDPFDMEVGGRVDESAGPPVRVQGKVVGVTEAHGMFWVGVGFGRGNVLLLSRYLTQVMEPSDFEGFAVDLARFKVIAIKSRVHFRRGFDDSGFAKTILLVEPDQPYLGTVRLDGLPYQHVDLKKFYPYGTPQFP